MGRKEMVLWEALLGKMGKHMIFQFFFLFVQLQSYFWHFVLPQNYKIGTTFLLETDLKNIHISYNWQMLDCLFYAMRHFLICFDR